MGLISALKSSARSMLADQWREYFYCDSLSVNTLMTRGVKKQGKNSSNTKGTDNVISNGSIIAVADGQCMLIVEQGKVVEICAEPGEFIWDSSTEPSLFYGKLGENIKNSFMQVGKRFAFGGDVPKDQRVYYINTKEITGNKYGTANPIPFRVVDNNIGLDVDIAIKCHGEYSYRISDPVMFYTNLASNVTSDYKRDQIDSQLKTEFLTALQPAFARISEMGVRYSALPAHTTDMANALNAVLSEQWSHIRGISVVSVGVSSVTASEEDEKMIKELQKNAVLRNPGMAAAHITAAQTEAMKSAAANESTGPMLAFAGMNMANMVGGMNAGSLFEMAQNQNQPQQASAQQVPVVQKNTWTCECGHSENTGKFCAECGKPQPKDAIGWVCECGATNKGKFCPECGKKKPAGALQYRCDKCGWEPDNTTNIPKFCPECGDPFDENDIVK